MTAPLDSAEQLRRLARVQEIIRCTRVGLGLLVLLALGSLIGAASTAAPATNLYGAIALWFLAQAGLLAAAVLGLRALRRRRFGRSPSPLVRAPSDALLYVAACAGGALALAAFGPALVAGPASITAIACVGFGVILLLGGLRGALLYVLRE